MKEILFIVPSMRTGGSEKVILNLVNNIDRTKFIPILVLLKKEGHFLNEIDNNIAIIDLNVKQARFAIFKLYFLIRKRNPSFVFSTLGHLNLIISFIKYFLPSSIKFIARESSIPSFSHSNIKNGWIFKLLYKLLYNNFDKIVSQSNYMKNDLIKNYNIESSKLAVINNPIDIEKIRQLSMQENRDIKLSPEKINILSVGRLNSVKRYELQLDILKSLGDKFTLTIIGEGIEINSLLEKINILKLKNQIEFLGLKTNPYMYMKKFDCLLVTSKYEGFPNVVLEANLCGIPVLGFNCPGGISEIIINNYNGFLVENNNTKLLLDTIKSFNKSVFDRNEISKNIEEKYALEKIIKEYENLFLVLEKENNERNKV
ncbi:glycosyltransferase [Aliarcobacter butzleri]|uniref:glycosyltransferase n=1 Tax=Aliarcobacter butzleri TaxID=28197 RepID=UPI00263C6AF6|nr:glycosyltransferase [Aliarcobacter butzleri]MDN5080227.1 glycosyltransferase [Aliarcobacter butzleri]